MYRGGGLFGCALMGVFVLLFMIIFFMFLLSVAIGVAIAYAIYQVVLWLTTPQPRLFGASPMSRWSNAYEQGLFLLEKHFKISTNTSPQRILVSVAIITLTPITIIGLVMPFLSPTSLGILYGIGFFLILMTTQTLTQPYDWFDQDNIYNDEQLQDLGIGDVAYDYDFDELLPFNEW